MNYAKKNFPILVLLLTAAFVFSGCDKKMPTLVPDEFQPLFDPDDAYVDRCTRVLTDTFKYPKSRIKKSSLYSFKSQSISYANEYGNSSWDIAIQESFKVNE